MRFNAVARFLGSATCAALLIVVLALALGCGGDGDAGLAKDAMAQVGATIITQDQYNQKLEELEKQLGTRVPNKDTQADEYKAFQREVLDYMVTLEIATQKQAALKVSVTDSQIQDQIDQIKAMFGGDEAKYKDALEQQSMTEAELRANLEEQTLLQAVIESVTTDATVSATESQAYYTAHKDDFKVPESRLTRHMLFAPVPLDSSTTATQADWDAAKARADNVREQLSDGDDFGQLAKENSDDTATKELGGDLGEVEKGQMAAEFEDAAFALEVSKVSEPVKTEFGYHLIQVTQITEARSQTYDEVKDQISAMLLDEERQQIWADWLTQTKKELAVVYKDGWAPAVTSTTATTKAAAGGEKTTTTTAGQ